MSWLVAATSGSRRKKRELEEARELRVEQEKHSSNKNNEDIPKHEYFSLENIQIKTQESVGSEEYNKQIEAENDWFSAVKTIQKYIEEQASKGLNSQYIGLETAGLNAESKQKVIKYFTDLGFQHKYGSLWW